MVKIYPEQSNKSFGGKRAQIVLHIATWVILFMLSAYLLYSDSGSDPMVIKRTYVQIALYAIIFYVNYLVFSPLLFFRKRRIVYFLCAVLLVSGATVVNEYAFKLFKPNSSFEKSDLRHNLRMQPPQGFPFTPQKEMHKRPKAPSKNWPLYNFIISTVFLSGFGLGLSSIDKYTEQEKQRKEAEKAKLNSELAFLKNQINPHFLFNTLNNIYALVQTNVGDGQKAILQLSKLMRYILYETEKGNRLLSQEIDFMQTYIGLMQLRISEKVLIQIHFPEHYNNIAIPPLLFLPFVENAFKHGISYRRASFININLEANPGNITFVCSNSIVNSAEEVLKPDSGIGLENVKKRLSLLFPDKHSLTVTETNEKYEVVLQIDIS